MPTLHVASRKVELLLISDLLNTTTKGVVDTTPQVCDCLGLNLGLVIKCATEFNALVNQLIHLQLIPRLNRRCWYRTGMRTDIYRSNQIKFPCQTLECIGKI